MHPPLFNSFFVCAVSHPLGGPMSHVSCPCVTSTRCATEDARMPKGPEDLLDTYNRHGYPMPSSYTSIGTFTPTAVMASLVLIVDILALASFFLVILAFNDHRRRRGLPYPPGPRPLPLIGNLLDIPKEYSWLTYTHLSKVHGKPLTYHYGSVFNRTIGRGRALSPCFWPGYRHIEHQQGHQGPP